MYIFAFKQWLLFPKDHIVACHHVMTYGLAFNFCNGQINSRILSESNMVNTPTYNVSKVCKYQSASSSIDLVVSNGGMDRKESKY